GRAPRPDPLAVRVLPAELAALVRDLMAIDPAARPQDIPAIIATLEGAIAAHAPATAFDPDLYRSPAPEAGPPSLPDEDATAVPRPASRPDSSLSPPSTHPPTDEVPAGPALDPANLVSGGPGSRIDL